MPASLARPVAQHAPLTALQAEVDAIERVFSDAVEALIAGREGLVSMIGALRSYEEGLQSCIDQDLPRGLARLAERLEDAETRDADSLQALGRMISDLSSVNRPLHHLQELIRTLEIFSSTASVVEAEAELSGGSNFSSQIKSLSVKSYTGLKDLKALVGGLKTQVETLRTTQEQHASAGLQRLAGIGDQLMDFSRGVEADLVKAQAPARRVHDVAERIGERMNRALAALQIGDSFRQRLEHVIEALRTCEARGRDSPSAGTLIRMIAARQLFAAADALGRALASLPGDLRAIQTDTRSLLNMGHELKSDTSLSARVLPIKDLSARSLSALQSGQAHRRMLEDRIGAMGAVVDEVKGTLDRQAVLDEDMKLGSVNVSLLSRSAVRGGSALNYVAHEIAGLIERCLAQRLDVVDMLSEIVASISQAQDQQALSADLKAIGDDLDGLARVLQIWEALSAGIDELLATGPASATAFGDCADRMAAQHALVDRVRAIAAQLECGQASAEPRDLYRDAKAAEAADWMRSLYSVPEERELHDEMCGIGAANHAANMANPQGSEPEGDDAFDWF